MDPAEPGLDRRELAARSLRLALAAAPAAALAATTTGAGTAAAQTADDTLLTGVIGLEQSLVVVYARALASGTLDPGRRRLAAVLRDQDRIHARALSRALSEFTDPPPPPRGGNAIPGLEEIGSAKGYLELALGFENQAYLAYLDAIGPLGSAATRRLVASIGASTAQHLALLRRTLGRTPVTDAFETGTGG